MISQLFKKINELETDETKSKKMDMSACIGKILIEIAGMPKNMQIKINNLGINDGFASFSTANCNYTIIKKKKRKRSLN